MGNFLFWKMRRHMITKDNNNNTKNYVIKSAILQSHFLPNRHSQMLMCCHWTQYWEHQRLNWIVKVKWCQFVVFLDKPRCFWEKQWRICKKKKRFDRTIFWFQRSYQVKLAFTPERGRALLEVKGRNNWNSDSQSATKKRAEPGNERVGDVICCSWRRMTWFNVTSLILPSWMVGHLGFYHITRTLEYH